MTKSLLCILLFFTSFVAFSQTSTNNIANMDNAMHVTLKATSNVYSDYVLNVSTISFVNADSKQTFFSNLSDNLLTFSYDKAKDVVVLKLNHYPGSTINSIEQWNAYINSNTAKYLKIYNSLK